MIVTRLIAHHPLAVCLAGPRQREHAVRMARSQQDMAVGHWLRWLVGGPMHAGLGYNVPDFRMCVRSNTLDPVSEFLYWSPLLIWSGLVWSCDGKSGAVGSERSWS